MKHKKRILMLSNLYNEDIAEDLFLKKKLTEYYDVKILHPIDSINHFDSTDLIFIRNIRPTAEYYNDYKKIKNHIRSKKIKSYNPLTGKGDMKGKKYLANLYKQGYQVIPTICNTNELKDINLNNQYFIKPIFGGSSKGCKIVSLETLLNNSFPNYIIQPYININFEVSYYYIDGVLQYSLYTEKGKDRRDLNLYSPSDDEIKLANSFIAWNNLKYGIQRIDFCIDKNGKKYLLEIEDECPYLSLLDIPKIKRDIFVENLIISINKIVGN